MASGFVQRWKGKISGASLWLGGSQKFGPGARATYSTAAGTNGLAIGTLGPEGVVSINASSGASVFTLTDQIQAGFTKLLDLVVTSSVFIKAPTGVALDATTTNLVFKSTYSQRVSVIGLSSVALRITDVYPDTTAGGAPVGSLTLSATT